MKPATLSSNVRSLHQQAMLTSVQDAPLRFVAADANCDHRQLHSPHLTPRQQEVLALLCEGLPNKLICRRLNIATGTVKVHISVILRELGASSRLQAVVMARRWGLPGDSGIDNAEQADVPAVAAHPATAAARRANGALQRLAAAY